MSNSLRDQLLGLGFKSSPAKPGGPKTRDSGGKGGRPGGKPTAGGRKPPARTGAKKKDDIDLAKAYALRARREKDDRLAEEQARQEEARKRREARARLATLVEGKALNDEAADIARHFEYGGKIKRIYVTADQLKALNAGQLGVLQQNGRYLLVTAALLAEAEAVFAPAVALKVDPDAPVDEDPYADPKFQVPDDLVW